MDFLVPVKLSGQRYRIMFLHEIKNFGPVEWLAVFPKIMTILTDLAISTTGFPKSSHLSWHT